MPPGNSAGRAELGALLFENYQRDVKPHIRVMDPVAALFEQLGDGGYQVTGKELVFHADLALPGGAMATSGWLPDSMQTAPTPLRTTPSRLYARRAIDNFINAITEGPGAIESLSARLNREIWLAYERTYVRHVHGSSAATVAVVATRPATAAGVGATTLTLKNGYGHAGQPVAFIEPGEWFALHDVSAGMAILGSAVVDSWNPATNTITFKTPIDNGTTLAADGDLLVVSTTPAPTARHFETERGKAPLGLMDIIDPLATNASYLTVNESANPRIRPLRRASTAFGVPELMKFVGELRAKSSSDVTPNTHVMSTQEGILMALAENISSTSQFQQTPGRELEGGWTTVRVAGHDFVTSPNHLFNVLYAHSFEDYHHVDLDGDAEVWDGDGSMYQRLADYDGKEFFIKHYYQRFASRRNRLGALTGIPNVDAARYTMG